MFIGIFAALLISGLMVWLFSYTNTQ